MKDPYESGIGSRTVFDIFRRSLVSIADNDLLSAVGMQLGAKQLPGEFVQYHLVDHRVRDRFLLLALLDSEVVFGEAYRGRHLVERRSVGVLQGYSFEYKLPSGPTPGKYQYARILASVPVRTRP